MTITIPVYATPPALLDACFRSIATARGPGDQVFVVIDGPQPTDLEDVIGQAPGLGFQLVRQSVNLGMVANWNSCLQLGSHQLVHVMHADDAVNSEFYLAVRRAMQFDQVAVVAAGQPPGAATVLRGEEAATYLLSAQKPPTGSFVLRRAALGTPLRGFDPRFPYCPDEELFLRMVASGDLALVDPKLYIESRHDRQARYFTWLRPDFADVYYAARTNGARAVGANLVPSALRETSRGLLSVGRFLCSARDGRAARGVSRSIIAHDKGALMNWRYWALLLLAASTRIMGRSGTAPNVPPVSRPRSEK